MTMKETIDRCIEVSGIKTYQTSVKIPVSSVEITEETKLIMAGHLAKFLLETGWLDIETEVDGEDAKFLNITCAIVPASMTKIRAMLGVAYDEGKQEGRANLGILAAEQKPVSDNSHDEELTGYLPAEPSEKKDKKRKKTAVLLDFNKPISSWTNEELDMGDGKAVLNALLLTQTNGDRFSHTEQLELVRECLEGIEEVLVKGGLNSVDEYRYRKSREALRRASKYLSSWSALP